VPGDTARARGGHYANLLSSGAKPFLYRSGVFRLLGLVAEPHPFNGAPRFHTELNYLQPREPVGIAAGTVDPSPGARPALPEPSRQSQDGGLDHRARSTPARSGGDREGGTPARLRREDVQDVAPPGAHRAVPVTQSSVTIPRANASAPTLDGSGCAVGPSRASEPGSDRRRSDGPSSGSAVFVGNRTLLAVPQVRRSPDTKATTAWERPPHEAVETGTGSPADAAAVPPRPHDIVDVRGIRHAAGEGGGSRVPVEQSRRNSPYRAPSLDSPVHTDARPHRHKDDAAASAAHRTAIDSLERVRTASRQPAGRRGRDTAARDQAIESAAQHERPRDPVAAPPRRVTVVNAVGSAPPRLPRAFWANSVLRSMHLRRLR
jgi:hypothetical protein